MLRRPSTPDATSRTRGHHPGAFVLAVALATTLVGGLRAEEEDRETRVRKDRERTDESRWIYNDLDAAFARAKETGRPILAVFRCIPCESCRGFDEQVAEHDARIAERLAKFVCVRVPQMNGIDLKLFQLDFDLSAFVVFLNADRTIYGRFGSRSTQKDKEGDLSVEAFRETLDAVLDLHARFDKVRPALRAKTAADYQGPARPELYPSLAGKYRSVLDVGGNLVKSCIHCHQVREAERLPYLEADEPIPDRVLYPWPETDALGIALDPRKRATVTSVEKGTAGAVAGLRAGDEILALGGQPLVSIADASWVLHHAPDAGELAMRVRRDGDLHDLVLPLEKGWRTRSDLSWRVTSWELRRLATGGILLVSLTAEERAERGLPEKGMALLAKHVGQYGDHARAKRAGFKNGDVIVSINGRTDDWRETDVFAYVLREVKHGATITWGVRRGDDERSFRFERP